jgi:hypothetical protein
MASRHRFVLLLAAALVPALLGTAHALPDHAVGGQGNRAGLERDVGNLASDATQGQTTKRRARRSRRTTSSPS